jgi:hypothetical protein
MASEHANRKRAVPRNQNQKNVQVELKVKLKVQGESVALKYASAGILGSGAPKHNANPEV